MCLLGSSILFGWMCAAKCIHGIQAQEIYYTCILVAEEKVSRTLSV